MGSLHGAIFFGRLQLLCGVLSIQQGSQTQVATSSDAWSQDHKRSTCVLGPHVSESFAIACGIQEVIRTWRRLSLMRASDYKRTNSSWPPGNKVVLPENYRRRPFQYYNCVAKEQRSSRPSETAVGVLELYCRGTKIQQVPLQYGRFARQTWGSPNCSKTKNNDMNSKRLRNKSQVRSLSCFKFLMIRSIHWS